MRILTLFSVAALMFFSAHLQAQDLSKEELKKWKSEVKKYKKDPALLKMLTEEHRFYQKESENLQRQLSALKAQQTSEGQDAEALRRKEQEVIDLNNQLMSAQSTIQQLRTELAQKPEPQPNVDAIYNDYSRGLVFRVQIGAYRKTTAPGQPASGGDLTVESSDGMQKILVGNFSAYEEAKEMMDYFKQIGLKDAWVVPYRDGQRITLKEALNN